MLRHLILAALTALGLATTAQAGELDREHAAAPAVPAAVAGGTVGSELDAESPSQAFFWRGPRWGGSYVNVGFGGGGFGFSYSSYYPAYYGGGWGYNAYRPHYYGW